MLRDRNVTSAATSIPLNNQYLTQSVVGIIQNRHNNLLNSSGSCTGNSEPVDPNKMHSVADTSNSVSKAPTVRFNSNITTF